MKLSTLKTLTLPCLLVIGLLMLCCCARVTTETLTGATMGTSYQVKVVSDRDIDAVALQANIDDELIRINQIMSTYIPESNLSRFNQAPLQTPVEVPEDLMKVILLSRQVHEQSHGAFDITVGPLVNLWGFGPAGSGPAGSGTTQHIPDDDQIDHALELVGMEHLEIGSNTLVRRKNIYVDLSGLAKGFAVDQLSQLLLDNGFENHMVEIGGEIKASGVNDRNTAWVIAIEKPEHLSRSIFRTLPLRNLGMATSGDYRNYREVDGKRYSHTMDPRTGQPVAHNLASVTVLDDSAVLADALATAINVMGLEQGMMVAQEHNLLVLFIINTNTGFEEHRSPALETYLR